jgi:hypothetical protein
MKLKPIDIDAKKKGCQRAVINYRPRVYNDSSQTHQGWELRSRIECEAIHVA